MPHMMFSTCKGHMGGSGERCQQGERGCFPSATWVLLPFPV